MTCPHCGADASAGQKFCPKCSRLVDSPLLKIKQQIDAAREEIRRDLNAARTVRFSPPAPPLVHATPPPVPQYQVSVATLGHAESQSPYKYAPHPSQTPALRPPPSEVPRETILRAQNKRQRKKQQRDEGTRRAQHTDATHRFDPIAAEKKALEEAKAAAALGPVPERFKRPVSFSMLALLDLIGAAVFAYTALRLTAEYPEPRPPIIELSRILSGATAFLFVVTAFGMWRLHPYGRFFQRLFLLPVMLWVPIGTIYGVATWLYLGSKVTRLYFSGRSPRSLNATEQAAWRTSEKAAPVFAFLIFAFGFIPGIAYATFISGTLPVVLNEAQQAFPQVFSQLTATPDVSVTVGQEAVEATPAPTGDPASVAVSEIRTMQRAQAVYAGLNEGYYDRVECVLAPAKCIRNGDGRNNAVLLDQRFREEERNEYRYRLYLFGVPAVRSDTASPTSMRGYAYRAVPAGGVGTGYCGDETGMVCSFDSATFASDRGNGGRCPNVCDLVQP